jgi:hypothetical protein
MNHAAKTAAQRERVLLVEAPALMRWKERFSAL